MHLPEHFSEEGVERALVEVRNITQDFPAGWVLQDVLSRLHRREVAAPNDLVRRRRALGCCDELLDLRPLKALGPQTRSMISACRVK